MRRYRTDIDEESLSLRCRTKLKSLYNKSLKKYDFKKIALLCIFLLMVTYSVWKIKHIIYPDIPQWLIDLRMPSPYKREALVVHKIFWEEIESTNTTIQKPTDTILIGINIRLSDFRRRHFIRTHQIAPYKSHNVTFRFFLTNPPPKYKKSIEYENNTYGDIIVLDNIPVDSREVAQTFKVYEFFHYVEKNMQVFKYVAKLDGDCFLNIPAYMDQFFNHTVQNLDYALISLYIDNMARFDYPMGAYEALSWKLMRFINRLYLYVPRTRWEEDLQLAWYISDAEIAYNKLALPSTVAYDFRKGWNPSWLSDVTDEAVRVHELKTISDYIMVGNCFDSEGVNKTKREFYREHNWTLNYEH
jgi:hypothetical protein